MEKTTEYNIDYLDKEFYFCFPENRLPYVINVNTEPETIVKENLERFINELIFIYNKLEKEDKFSTESSINLIKEELSINHGIKNYVDSNSIEPGKIYIFLVDYEKMVPENLYLGLSDNYLIPCEEYFNSDSSENNTFPAIYYARENSLDSTSPEDKVWIKL